MQRPWLNRRWIAYGIPFARRVTLCCGDKHLSRTRANRFETGRIPKPPELWGRSRRDRVPKTLVDLTTNLFRKSNEEVVLGRLRSLRGSISTMAAFEASTPTRYCVCRPVALQSD